MSLLKTKPHYFPTAIATESGWCNPITGEVLVSVGRLKSKLEAEGVIATEPVVTAKIIESEDQPIITTPEVVVEPIAAVVEPVLEPVVEQPKEIIMEEVKPVKVRKEYTRKIKVTEQTEKSVPADQKLIGEVVEHDLDKPVIGE
jgi:hypothetical protein